MADKAIAGIWPGIRDSQRQVGQAGPGRAAGDRSSLIGLFDGRVELDREDAAVRKAWRADRAVTLGYKACIMGRRLPRPTPLITLSSHSESNPP
jgi:hypothetical protein